MLTRKQRREREKAKAYAWVAYMFTHESEEIKRLLKYGTPSDRLIRLAARSRKMVVASGEKKKVFFPVSLNKSAGQKMIFKVAQDIDTYIKTIPVQAYELVQHVKENVTHRRKDTQANLHIVAEAIAHRAASEFKHEVLFAFDSINTWIKAVYQRELGYLTLRKCLELLESAGILKIREWGVRGNRAKCTKIEIVPVTSKLTALISKVDIWVDSAIHGMMAVYARESTTRQDVLEGRFHHYAAELLAKELSDGPAWPELVTGHFPAKRDKLVQAEEVSASMTFEEMLYEIQNDLRVGELVHSVQANGFSRASSNAAIR